MMCFDLIFSKYSCRIGGKFEMKMKKNLYELVIFLNY